MLALLGSRSLPDGRPGEVAGACRERSQRMRRLSAAAMPMNVRHQVAPPARNPATTAPEPGLPYVAQAVSPVLREVNVATAADTKQISKVRAVNKPSEEGDPSPLSHALIVGNVFTPSLRRGEGRTAPAATGAVRVSGRLCRSASLVHPADAGITSRSQLCETCWSGPPPVLTGTSSTSSRQFDDHTRVLCDTCWSLTWGRWSE